MKPDIPDNDDLIYSKYLQISAVIFFGLIAFFLGYVVYNSFGAKFNKKACLANLYVLANAIEAYTIETRQYPQTLDLNELFKYGAKKSNFICPANKKKNTVGYGINSGLAGLSWDEINAQDIIVADSKSPVFFSKKDFRYEHGFRSEKKYANTITKDKTILRYLNDTPANKKNKNETIQKPAERCWQEYSSCKQQCGFMNKSDPLAHASCPSDCWEKFNRCQNE